MTHPDRRELTLPALVRVPPPDTMRRPWPGEAEAGLPPGRLQVMVMLAMTRVKGAAIWLPPKGFHLFGGTPNFVWSWGARCPPYSSLA